MKDLRYLWILVLTACSAIVDADSSRLNETGQCDTDCDDDVACTRDECVNNVCQHTPLNDRCDAGFICNPNARNGSGCVPADCDLDCTDPPGCPGDSCFDCDEEGYCNDTADACVYVLRDEDDDGHGVDQVSAQDCSELDPNANDCDDTNAEIHPGQPEVCDGEDNDCDDEEDFTVETGRRCLGDVCSNPIPITLSSDSFTHTGELQYYVDNFNQFGDPFGSTCLNGAEDGGDVVYKLTVSQPIDLVIEAEAIGSPAIDPVLAVRNSAGCSPGNPSYYTYATTCHDDVNLADNGSRIYLQNFGVAANARTLYVALKGWDEDQEGPFQLTVTGSAPSASTCSTDSMDISAGGLLIGQLGPDNEQSPTLECDESGGDSTAQFSVANPGVPTSGELRAAGLPIMYLRTDSCSGTEIGCDGGSNVVIDFSDGNIDLGTTNYVITDGGDEGDYFFLRYQPPEP